MFPEDRQKRLDPILEALRQCPGIKSVQQDDFDSASIAVHLECLHTKGGITTSKYPSRFHTPIRTMKMSIRQALKGVGFNFTKWPLPEYISLGRDKVKNHYDTDMISLNVYV